MLTCLLISWRNNNIIIHSIEQNQVSMLCGIPPINSDLRLNTMKREVRQEGLLETLELSGRTVLNIKSCQLELLEKTLSGRTALTAKDVRKDFLTSKRCQKGLLEYQELSGRTV